MCGRMLSCLLLPTLAWNYPTAAQVTAAQVRRLQLRARPQLMRAADEADAPATTPATQVVRRDLGAYVGLTSIVALVPAVDWAGLGPETSNVARLLYFSAVALGSVYLGVKRQDLGESSPISSRSAALAPLFASAVLGGLYAILKFTELDPGAVYRLAACLFALLATSDLLQPLLGLAVAGGR